MMKLTELIKLTALIAALAVVLGGVGCSGDDAGVGSDGDSDSDSDGDSDGDTDGDTDADSDSDSDDPYDPNYDGPVVGVEPLECTTPEDAGGFTFVEIAKWKDGATAAYSMFHDDLCDYGVRGIQNMAVPTLNSRGLSGCLGAIANECVGSWDMVNEIQASGQEIGNHSYSHESISMDNQAEQVVGGKADFDANLNDPVTFFVYPYDYFTSETIAAVENAGHIGGRGGNRDDNDGFTSPPLNPEGPDNDFEVEFDVWPRTYSKYALYYPEDILSVHVWNAIDSGQWATREFHSVIGDGQNIEGNGFGPIEITPYETHLDFLVDAWAKNFVWTDNPSNVIRYRRAAAACTATVAGDTISYGTSAADCTAYATAVSVIVTTGNDVPSVQGMQGGNPVATRKISANTFSITADPTGGDVVLTGCSDVGPGVEPGDITPKPTPAESVCDIVTVTGDGSDGAMDDLERPEEQFQTLPNPSQADGRDGSWSWYPQNAIVEMYPEGENTVLRYAGESLGAWTGVTLAFLGGNGAGTCYDASAYTGIRFKIKGAVTTSDMLNGKVIVSMVTSETQSQTYGGDLDGTGGHFNLQVDVTGSWQTVEIAWADLNPPTWGDTASLTELATAKLQAVDWGISNTASSFEVFLDDIELY